MITSIIYKDGVTQTTTSGILHTFVEFLQSKCEPTQEVEVCVLIEWRKLGIGLY